MNDRKQSNAHTSDWLHILRQYLPFVAIANLVWEFAHLPGYTIWWTASASEMVFAAVHCTGGDILIATASIVLGLLLAGDGWPDRRAAFYRVGMLTVMFGLNYTIFSEWLNVEVREAWAYSSLMPVVPIINTGLSPVLQWILIPAAGLWWASRRTGSSHRDIQYV